MEDWSRQQGSFSKSWKGAMSEKWLLNISKGNLCQFNFNSGQFGRSCVGSGPDSTNIIESTLVRSATKYTIPWLQYQNNPILVLTLSYYVWNKIVWLLEKVLNNRLCIHRKNCCIYTFVSAKKLQALAWWAKDSPPNQNPDMRDRLKTGYFLFFRGPSFFVAVNTGQTQHLLLSCCTHDTKIRRYAN